MRLFASRWLHLGHLGWRGVLGLVVLAAGACTDRGSVTFQVNQPDLQVFNPVSQRLSEYELKTAHGALISVATVSTTTKQAVLPLGELPLQLQPVDMVMSLFSGSELLGMARIRDVMIEKEVQKTYEANVRKPLVFVGAALPPEVQAGNAVGDGQIFDFTAATSDLEHPRMMSPGTPKVPDGTQAAAVTSDGTLLLAGRKNMLTVYDTSNGNALDLPLSFTPVKVAVGPRDVAVVAVDEGDATGGGLAIIRNVAALHNDVAGVSPMVVRLPGVNPRTAAFSSDGQTIYVLTGGAADPCEPAAALLPNALVLVTLDGQIRANWPLPDFVSDLGVGSDGSVYLSRSSANQVARIDSSVDAGLPPPEKLFDATCPTSLRVVNGEVFVVTTGKHPDFTDAFTLLRWHDDLNPPSLLALGAPSFEVPLDSIAPPGPGQPAVTVTVPAKTLSGYDLAVTPDGQRAVLAARIRYHQEMEPFTIIDINCVADLDVVEYGLYIIDTVSGNAAYERRSQAVTRPATTADPCLNCDLAPFGTLAIDCPSGPGDRAAGLAAIFGGP